MTDLFKSSFIPLDTISEIDNSEESNTDELSLIVTLTNRFVSEACNTKRLYCPFCLFDFAFDFLLRIHIQETHLIEIKNFARVNLELFTFDVCLYCHAKFYTQNLLPKHIIRRHEENIVNCVSKIKPDGYVYCSFCPYKILQKQFKLLFIHLENKHLKTFEKMLTTLQTELSQRNLSWNNENEKYHLLENCMKMLTINADSNLSEHIDKIKPILKRSDSSTSTINVRRKLTFDLPNISTSSEFEEENKENINFQTKKSNFFALSRDNILRRSKNLIRTKNRIKPEASEELLKQKDEIRDSTNDDSETVFKVMPYRCGLCVESFSTNNFLLYHLKRVHPGFKLKARYRCGVCKAKFYKNSYLIRHYCCHHNKLKSNSTLNSDISKNERMV